MPVATLDDYFEAIAMNAPGFGGLYREADGQLVISLKNVEGVDRERVRAFVAAFLRMRRPSLEQRAADARFEAVGYSFAELRQFRRLAQPHIAGVKAVDINERDNSVDFGLDPFWLPNAREAIAGDPVLRDAPIRLYPAQEPVLGSGIGSHRERPVVGVLKVTIDWPAPYGDGVCSITEVVEHINPEGNVDPTRYAITAAHCFRYYFSEFSETASVGQPDLQSTNLIGNKIWSAPHFTSSENPTCDQDPNKAEKCRYSDAALIELSALGDPFRFFYQSTNDSLFTSENTGDLLTGDSVSANGFASGARSGTVSSTCVHLERTILTSAQWILCQTAATGISGVNGDSGGPVWVWDGGPEFAGIYWGKDGSGSPAYFSPDHYVATEIVPDGASWGSFCLAASSIYCFSPQ